MVVAETQTNQVSVSGSRVVAPTYRWPHAPHGATRQPESAGTVAPATQGIEVRELAAKDMMAAAQLLALRHRRARETSPELPAAYQSARPWFIELGRLFGRAKGVVATVGGEVVGFAMDVAGPQSHAVAPHADARQVHARLCAALS